MVPPPTCADKRYVFGGFALRFIPCEDCGASVVKSEYAAHVCDGEQRVEYQMTLRRDEIASVEDEIRTYFDSPKGRFEAWYAARQRKRP
jgi:hypothetical protein